MEFLIGIGIGILIGVISVTIAWCQPAIGTVHVKKVEDDELPYMFLELHKGVDAVISKRKVKFKVDARDYISHN